ncbi:MAG: helix-turn-helix domain-containing protein [Acinetobacter johnsonii]
MILTVPQAIKLLGVHRSTIYRMFETGDLKKVKLARSTRVELPEHLAKAYDEQIKALNL